MKKLLLLSALAVLTACGDTKPTAIEVSDLGKVGLQCFITRTPTIDDALNPFAGLSDLGGVMEEITKAPIKKGWKITSEDRSTATLNTKREGVNYACDYVKLDGKWALKRSMWDGEEAYSMQAETDVKRQAQLKQDTTWEEKGWAGESYKYYALPPKGADAMNGKQLAINCKPDDRGVMLNDFLSYGGGKIVEFSFDGNLVSYGVSGGGSNSYLGDLVESSFGTPTKNRVEVADKFIASLVTSKTVEVMGETFVVDQNELNKIPCISKK